MMRLIDKKLLLSLWETYSELDWINTHLNEIIRFKRDEMILDLRSTIAVPLYIFHVKTGLPDLMLQLNEGAIKILKEARLNFE